MSKFKVGEVCYVKSLIGRFSGFRDASVIRPISRADAVCEFFLLGTASEAHLRDGSPLYVVFAPCVGRETVACESSLRKKRPPRTDTEIADEDFIKELNAMIFRDEVKA